MASGRDEASLPVVGCGGVRLDQRASHASHKKLGAALKLVASYGSGHRGSNHTNSGSVAAASDDTQFPALQLREVLLGRSRATPPQMPPPSMEHSKVIADEPNSEEYTEVARAESSEGTDGAMERDSTAAATTIAMEAQAISEAATLPYVFNANLDVYQRAAVAFSLASEHVSLIHGPPGTGKTTTLVELLLQVGKRNRIEFIEEK